MYCESVGNTSAGARRCILETTTGSNHFLIHDQAVGKNGGAPIIYAGNNSFSKISI